MNLPQFTINRNAFGGAIALVGRASAKRSTLPIITSSVYIKAQAGSVILRSTDLEKMFEVTLPATVKTEGAVVVPYPAIVAFLAGGNTTDTVTVEDNTTTDKVGGVTGKILFRAGKDKLNTDWFDGDDFPHGIIEIEGTAVTVPFDVFGAAVRMGGYGFATDGTRPILQGVYLHSHNGTAHASSADGFRLAHAAFPSGDAHFSALINGVSLSESLNVLTKGDGDVTLNIGANRVELRRGVCRVEIQAIEGKFPDVQRLIPSETVERFTVNRAELVTALGRIRAMGATGNIAILRTDDNGLTVTAKGYVGESTIYLEAEVAGVWESAISDEFLAQALNAIASDAVTVRQAKGKADAVPFVIFDGDNRHVIMPISVGAR